MPTGKFKSLKTSTIKNHAGKIIHEFRRIVELISKNVYTSVQQCSLDSQKYRIQ